MSRFELLVTSVRDLAPAIKGFSLRRLDGGDLPEFTAGAHLAVELTLPDGRVESRDYSLVSTPSDRRVYEIAVLREANSTGCSAFMHERIKPGYRLSVSGPRNDFPLAADASEHLLIAGGIGITPILAMLRVLKAEGRRFDLHYCARTPDSMAFRAEVAALAGARAHFHFDGGDPRNGLDVAALLAGPVTGRHVYVCGPKPMIEAVIRTCQERGWPGEQVHFEFFAAAAPEAGDGEIEVVLARSKRTVLVPPNQTILAALIAAGEEPLSDCTRGECGVCVTAVLEGEPLHRDHYLTDSEKAAGKSMCICISRARGKRLVLDL